MKYLLSLIFCTVPFWMFAKNIDLKRAEEVAIDFLSASDVKTNSNNVTLTLIWDGESAQTHAQVAPAFYVFNCTSAEGFVIVAGDDVVQPILGYSPTGQFEVQNMPPNLKYWMEFYRNEVTWAREEGIEPTVKVTNAWKNIRSASLITGEVIVKNTTAQWGQMHPYNHQSLIIDNIKAPTGCVATALAIIMKYHQWPDIGTGSHTYIAYSQQRKLSADFDEPYVWSNMPMSYVEYTNEQRNQVARLMYHCGVFSEMDYRLRSSEAGINRAIIGMVDHMKYDKGAYIAQRDWYEEDEWQNLIRETIHKEELVLYGGRTEEVERHHFILDGYTDKDYYHVNWGWAGSSDGYYLLSTLDPNEQGVGGNSGDRFSVEQNAVIGLKKAEENSSYQDILAFDDTGGMEIFAYGVYPNQVFQVTFSQLRNHSIRETTMSVAFALVNGAGERVENISEELTSFQSINGGSSSAYIPCKITKPIEAGSRIQLFYKSSDATEWIRVKGGKKAVSEILLDKLTSVHQVPNEESLDISMDGEKLTIRSLTPLREVSLYNAAGHLLAKYSQMDEEKMFTCSCSGYPSGTYLLQVATAKGVKSRKFIKK